MALDKLVDGAQLDTDLTAVANAIRTKGGTSAQLAFPADFVSAVNAIQTGGGGWTTEGIADGSEPVGRVEILRATKIIARAFSGRNAITSVFVGSQVSTIQTDAFSSCGNLTSFVFLPGNTQAAGCVFGCNKLETADLGGNVSSLMLASCPVLNTIVLRKSASRATLPNTNTLVGTPFKSGGSGGTIYIPKVLYDHLGDGSALDYKAATNWSTFDGYGTITWAQIEGSIYETQYADGTPIPSE